MKMGSGTQLSLFKRVKHHQMPGDISKYEKIRMREKREDARSRTYVRMLALKTRATLKERTRVEIIRQQENED